MLLNQAQLKVDFIKKVHYITQEQPEHKPVTAPRTGTACKCARLVAERIQNTTLAFFIQEGQL